MNFKYQTKVRDILCGGLLGILGLLPVFQIQAEPGVEHAATQNDQLADRGGGGHGGGDHAWSGGGHRDGDHNWSGGSYHDGYYHGGYVGGYGGPGIDVNLGGVPAAYYGNEYYPYGTSTPNVYINGGYVGGYGVGGGYGSYGHGDWHGGDYHGWHGNDHGWQGGGSRGTSERTAPGTGYNRGGGGMRR